MSGNRAPSLYLDYKENIEGDIIMQDVLVPRDGSAECTYYCCISWNAGQNGGGYCGIQDHPDGRCYIFSLWDPHNSKNPIEYEFKHPGTVISRFVGEGTGLKSMNFDLGWNPDSWYTLVTRRWSDNWGEDGNTYFGFWVQDQVVGKWTHIVTMNFPEKDIFFLSKTSSFLEDWAGNGQKIRSVKFRDGRKRAVGGEWQSLRSAKFWVNQEDACRNFNDNFNACIDSDCFFMQSGHDTAPEPGLGPSKDFTCESTNSPRQPPISFTITGVTRTGSVCWHVPESRTPQFRYTIKIEGGDETSDVGPLVRECEVCLPNAGMVTVVLEDILGREVSQSFKFQN